MSLQVLVDFCLKYGINMSYVTFWYGHKEVYAIFNKGSIPGILYPEDEGFEEWAVTDEEGYLVNLPAEMAESGVYIHRVYDEYLVVRID